MAALAEAARCAASKCSTKKVCASPTYTYTQSPEVGGHAAYDGCERGAAQAHRPLHPAPHVARDRRAAALQLGSI